MGKTIQTLKWRQFKEGHFWTHRFPQHVFIQKKDNFPNLQQPLFTWHTYQALLNPQPEGQFQTWGFIFILTQKCPSEASLCQWQLNHGCWGSVCTCRKQTGRCFPSEALSLWMQHFRTQLGNISLQLLGRLHLRSTPFCPLPKSPLSIWSANLVHTRVTCSILFLQAFQEHSEFKGGVLFSRVAPFWKTHKSCITSACHISTHARDVNSVSLEQSLRWLQPALASFSYLLI